MNFLYTMVTTLNWLLKSLAGGDVTLGDIKSTLNDDSSILGDFASLAFVEDFSSSGIYSCNFLMVLFMDVLTLILSQFFNFYDKIFYCC